MSVISRNSHCICIW